MKLKTTAGVTSQILQIVVDDTSSTTGAGLGSLVYNSAGLAAKYKKRGDSVWTSISLQTITTLGTFQAGGGGFRESDSGAGGGYEFQPPDACFSTAGVVWIELYGAANMAPVRIEIELDEIDYLDGDGAGLSRLDTNVGSRNATTPPTAPTIATQVRTELSTELARIDENVSAAKTLTVAYDAAKTAAQAGDQMALVDGAISAAKFVANAITATVLATNAIGSNQLSDAAVAKIEAALLNEGDGQALIAAIIAAIDAADIDASLVAGLTRDAILDRVLPGNHDTADTVGLFIQQLDALISSRSSHTATDVWAVTTRTLSAFGFSVDLNSDQSGVTIGTVNSVADKTGYTLTQLFPSNFSSMAINGSGEVTTSNPSVGGGSQHTPADVANVILANPANLLLTDASGRVTASNSSSCSSSGASSQTVVRRGQTIYDNGTLYANPSAAVDQADSNVIHLAYRKASSSLEYVRLTLSTGALTSESQIISTGVDPHLLWQGSDLWCFYSRNLTDVFVKIQAAGAFGGPPTTIMTDSSGDGGHYEDVHACVMGNGNVVCTAEWEVANGGESAIDYVIWDKTTGWGSQVRLIAKDGSTNHENPECFAIGEMTYILVASAADGSYQNNVLTLFSSSDYGVTWDDGIVIVSQKSQVEYEYFTAGGKHFITTCRNFDINGVDAIAQAGIHELGETLSPIRIADVGWSQDAGTLTVGDGYADLVCNGNVRPVVVRDVADGSDVDVTFENMRCRGTTTQDLRVLFAYTDIDNHFMWLLNGSTAQLYEVTGGGSYDTVGAAVALATALDTNYDVRVVHDGTANTQALYVDGTLVASRTSSAHTTGKIGFGGGQEVSSPELRQPVRCGRITVKGDWVEDWKSYSTFLPIDGIGTTKFASGPFTADGQTYVFLEDRDNNRLVLYTVDTGAVSADSSTLTPEQAAQLADVHGKTEQMVFVDNRIDANATVDASSLQGSLDTLLARTASNPIIVHSSRPAPGLLELTRDADYNSGTPHQAIELPIDASIDLAGITASFEWTNRDGGSVLTKSPTVLDPGGASQRLSFDLTAAETVNLRLGAIYEYRWVVTFPNTFKWIPEGGILDLGGDAKT